MLNKPPVNEPEILALFANKGSIPVQVKLYGNDGAIAAELELGVHGIDETSVERLGDGTVRVFDLAGKLLSSARVPSHRDAANFDIPLGTFYYQIEDGKVRPVPVKDAGPLKKRWKEIQEQTQRRAS